MMRYVEKCKHLSVSKHITSLDYEYKCPDIPPKLNHPTGSNMLGQQLHPTFLPFPQSQLLLLTTFHNLLLTLRDPSSLRNHQTPPCNGTHRHHTCTSDGIRSRAARPPIQGTYMITHRVSRCPRKPKRSFCIMQLRSEIYTLPRSIASKKAG